MAEEMQVPNADQYQVDVKGKNFEVTEILKEYVTQKLKKVERLVPQTIRVTVYLETRRGSVNLVEILYHFSHFDAMVSGRAEEMYEAINLAVNKLQHKLRKWKSRIQDHHAKVPLHVEKHLAILDRRQDDLDEINDMIEEENLREIEEELRPPKIVEHKKHQIPTLTMDEACMKMELGNLPFLLYRSEEDQKLKLLYPQGDGTLGIIEAE